MKRISQRLKLLRKEKELNQEDIAKMLNITRAAYGKIETGVNDPTLRHLIKLAVYYNVSLDWLITGEKENTQRFDNHSKEIQKMLNDMENSKSLLHAILSFYYAQLEKKFNEKLSENCQNIDFK
jgi:transcriptional regulator with XRE-family HTH domain